MNLLLDSHILLWWLSGSRRLPPAARKAIADSARAYVSAATVWEIAIKIALGKLEFRGEIAEQLTMNNLLPLAVTVPHAVAAGALPVHHSDPFDRMLIAQAKLESLTLVTHDARLRDYGVHVLIA
ncbi:MAG: type II toxin-antitoxin system VapC family toxin [Acidobacteriota bacterium]